MKDDRLYLIHLSESIEKIESYTKGLDFPSFMQNTLIQDAVLRNLQVLAESTQRQDPCYVMKDGKLIDLVKEKNVNPAPRTPHPSPLTPHPSPRTPHPSPRTPHPAPRTPHLEPRTSNPAPRTPHPAPRKA